MCAWVWARVWREQFRRMGVDEGVCGARFLRNPRRCQPGDGWCNRCYARCLCLWVRVEPPSVCALVTCCPCLCCVCTAAIIFALAHLCGGTTFDSRCEANMLTVLSDISPSNRATSAIARVLASHSGSPAVAEAVFRLFWMLSRS